jgi:REP element-mobilizing transposase RayT
MSHSYSSNRVHVIFSTKERKPCISDDFQPKLWAYMAGIAHNQGFETMIIGGVRNHVHALLMLPPTVPLAKAVQFLKGSSSKWINKTEGQCAWAGRIRRLQREWIADLRCRALHPKPARPSRKEEF